MKKTLMLMLSLAVVMAWPYPSYGQIKRQTVTSPALAKRRVTPTRLARATPGYRFRQLYHQPMPPYPGTADATVVDTLQPTAAYAPRLYVARVPPTLPVLRRGGYERRLRPLFEAFTRQYYRRDSRRFAESIRAILPGENIIPPFPGVEDGPWLASRAEVISISLLVIPAGDSLLNAVVRHTTYSFDQRLDAAADIELYDYTDSSYCFRLARGRLRVISARPSTYYPSAPPGLNTLEQRLGALARTDPRLATRARQVLRRPCPWGHQLPLHVEFTPSGLWLLYACYAPPPQPEAWPPDNLETVDIILPYDSLPPRLFRFLSP